MQVVKSFNVLGDDIEILIPSSESRSSFSLLVTVAKPGGGPPPHFHDNEDEIFRVLEGEFEIFDGKSWSKLPIGEYAYVLRGNVHTFRNVGDTVGRIQVIAIPGKFDGYLEAISPLQMPQDGAKLTEISDEYGIHFVMPDPAA